MRQIRLPSHRSRSDVEKDYIRQWKETTARDGSIAPRTFWSTVIFVPMWIKYEAIPEIVRYAWYIVWSALKIVHNKYHKWAVLQGTLFSLGYSMHPYMCLFSRVYGFCLTIAGKLRAECIAIAWLSYGEGKYVVKGGESMD